MLKTKRVKGKRKPQTSNNYGSENYCQDLKMNVPIVWEVMNTVFLFYHLPENSRYIKSEDILYEIKKNTTKKQILEHGLTYDYMQDGLSLEKAQSI